MYYKYDSLRMFSEHEGRVLVAVSTSSTSSSEAANEMMIEQRGPVNTPFRSLSNVFLIFPTVRSSNTFLILPTVNYTVRSFVLSVCLDLEF